jgi:putative DNA primase/helicase
MNAMSQIPPVEAFRAAMLEKLGNAPGNVIGDGEIHRFSTGKGNDAGWYVLHDDEFAAGKFGDWRTGAKFSWSAQEGRELTPDERRRLERLEIARGEKIEAAHQRAAEVANEHLVERRTGETGPSLSREQGRRRPWSPRARWPTARPSEDGWRDNRLATSDRRRRW